MGIGAIGRDEKLASYLMRIVASLLFNFTLGVFGAVVAFVFGLYALIQSYKASLLSGFMFFLLASLSACAFALTWIIGLYLATAGTVYVGAKVLASNVRLEDSQAGGGQRRNRVRYE